MKKIDKKVAYHLQVYNILKHQIISGALASGDKISENKIAQEIGVSRSPVREALRMLKQDELLLSTDSGLIVNPLDSSTLREIYQCRIALESFAAGLAAQNITEKQLSILEESVLRSRSYHKSGQYDKVLEANSSFHSTINNLCGNHSLIKMIDKYSSLVDLTKSQIFTKYKRGEEPYLTEHEEIIEALRNRDCVLVEALMRKHINGDYSIHVSLLNQAASSGDSGN
ncbi:GntR family transcriptional regulator [Clostridium sp. AM58-1XD]|uniref:GntR family transcriptional regulator n=1 Tax=Clostridium sp. AM58-1XD TaxID=2292307 RepID=UPI0015F531CF|nr:GntR family transcriptional regulator [Clostridium sp. AM58-1XD]